MSYITTTLRHFGAMQDWAKANQAEATLDVGSFGMEIKARSRYHRFFPRFIASAENRFFHTNLLTDGAWGFIGWLPYQGPLRWDISDDKLFFKRFLRDHGMATPDWWQPLEAESDFVIKRSRGSFGYDVFGPYRAGGPAPVLPRPKDGVGGEVYAEKFVEGRNIKAWYWGSRPFFAHLHPYPTISGDGRTIREELEARFQTLGRRMNSTPADLATIENSLLYQGKALDDLLPSDETVWLDYRYGRRYRREPLPAVCDNDLPTMISAVVQQLDAIGIVVSEKLKEYFAAPLLYTLDGVVDESDKVWWLEVNSNPIFPPDGYEPMLSSMFGAPAGLQ